MHKTLFVIWFYYVDKIFCGIVLLSTKCVLSLTIRVMIKCSIFLLKVTIKENQVKVQRWIL